MTPTERHAVKARRERAKRPTGTRYVYRHQWPVTDDTMTMRQLAQEALPDLRYAIAAVGAHPAGPPMWELGQDQDGTHVLVVTVPCVQKRIPVKGIDDLVVEHLTDEGVTPAQIAAMLGAPLDLVQLAVLRTKHYRNHFPADEDTREHDFDRAMEEAGLTNEDRMWRDRGVAS